MPPRLRGREFSIAKCLPHIRDSSTGGAKQRSSLVKALEILEISAVRTAITESVNVQGGTGA